MNKIKKIFGGVFTTMSVKEKTLFAKRLSFLVKAGVPILKSLQIIKDQTTSVAKSNILGKVIQDVSNGQFLATSLAKFKNNFDQFAVNIIRIGEESGTLDSNLSYLAEEMKKKRELQRKVVGALVYPIFIIVATLGIAGLLTVYIFPKVLPVFASLDLTLPITTRILIEISDILKNYGLYILAGLAALFIGFMALMKTSKGFRHTSHRVAMRIPLIGLIIKNYQLANICRTLGTLLKSDIRIVKAFSIASETTTNLVYQKELDRIAQGVVKGEKITTAMERNSRLFPGILTNLVDIGESTGELDETLMYLSDMYEIEVDELTKNLPTMLEPVLMVFMGIIVGFIAVSIITPIYEITQNLNP
jgi:type IV pilus assembly protein PilC